jgi:hypothetical protein
MTRTKGLVFRLCLCVNDFVPTILFGDAASSGMKAILSVLAMLIVAPLVAVTTLVCWQPERWGGSLNPLAIAVMALFGLLTVPLWPTYIPALIITPLLMNWISAQRAFARLSLPVLLGLSLSVGAVAGLCVMIRLFLMALNDAPDYHQALPLAGAGAVSGAITLTLICLVYRYEERRDEPTALPNSGSAKPLGNSGVTEGPPSVG